MQRRSLLALGLGAAGVASVPAVVWRVADRPPPPRPPGTLRAYTAAQLLDARYRSRTSGARTRLYCRTSGRRVAVLTEGARTVLLDGPARVYTEPSTTRARVSSTVRVQLGPGAWRPEAHLQDPDWTAWLAATLPRQGQGGDILSTTVQYLTGAPRLVDRHGVAYAADAGFGLDDDDGADFYDCLQIPWTFPDVGLRRPARRWAWRLDCSGYLRMVFGYRHGMTMYAGNDIPQPAGLLRSAWAIATRSPAVLVAAGRSEHTAPRQLGGVQPGDCVFFALHDQEPERITHSGIVLGRDNRGRMRFVSSRGTPAGPTFGDRNGAGVIDDGFFGARLRRAIRL